MKKHICRKEISGCIVTETERKETSFPFKSIYNNITTEKSVQSLPPTIPSGFTPFYQHSTWFVPPCPLHAHKTNKLLRFNPTRNAFTRSSRAALRHVVMKRLLLVSDGSLEIIQEY